MLKTGTLMDATLIAAPSSTSNAQGERYPEMRETRKGDLWHVSAWAACGLGRQSTRR